MLGEQRTTYFDLPTGWVGGGERNLSLNVPKVTSHSDLTEHRFLNLHNRLFGRSQCFHLQIQKYLLYFAGKKIHLEFCSYGPEPSSNPEITKVKQVGQLDAGAWMEERL